MSPSFRILVICSVASLASSPAFAQGTMIMSLSFSRQRGDLFAPDGPANIISSGAANWNGWDAGVDLPLNDWLTLAANFSGVYGSRITSSGCEAISPCTPSPLRATSGEYAVLAGPRVFTPYAGTLRAFADVMAGGLRANVENRRGDTSIAIGAGVGLELALGGRFAIRARAGGLQTRLFDYPGADPQLDSRISLGVITRR